MSAFVVETVDALTDDDLRRRVHMARTLAAYGTALTSSA
jgi:hypothetical protein